MPFQTSLNVEVDAALDGANVSLSGLDTAIDGVNTTLSGISSDVDSLETTVTSVESALDAVNVTLSGMLFREPVGGTSVSVTTSGAYTVCALNAQTPYEIRILPVVATGLAVGRYTVDGNIPDNDRAPIITTEDSPHTLYLREDGTFIIIKDSIYNANFTTTCYPTIR